MNARETAIHLENLRSSHEITRELQGFLVNSHPSIVLKCDHQGWHGKFNGLQMGDAEGIWLPLPWTCRATKEQVAADMRRRFPAAKIVVRI